MKNKEIKLLRGIGRIQYDSLNIINLQNYVIKELKIKLANIMYMYKMGTIAKRYWTKKKLTLHFSNKRNYVSSYLKDENDYHKNILVTAGESDSKIKQNILKDGISFTIKNINNDKGIIIENNVLNYLEHEKVIKGMEIFNKFDVVKTTEKSLWIVRQNFTTDIKKNSISLVDRNKIIEGQLIKGIGLHTNEFKFFQINSDKSFFLVYSYILLNFDDDLKQRKLIEGNTTIKKLDKIYLDLIKKNLEQIGINKIVIVNKIQTKKELLEYLSENWIKIKKEKNDNI